MRLHHFVEGKLIHDGAVGLEVEDAVGANDLAVAVKELGRGKAMTRIACAFAGMRVREGDPNLGDLVLGKEMLNLVDAGTQERHILQTFLIALLQSTPNPCSFDVDTDIIDVAMRPSQAHGVFSFATA